MNDPAINQANKKYIDYFKENELNAFILLHAPFKMEF